MRVGGDTVCGGDEAPINTAHADGSVGRAAPNQIRERFEQLYEDGRDDVYGFVLARCGDPSLAEEFTAEAFLAAWKHMFAHSESVGVGWVVTVARRRLIDHWRRTSMIKTRTTRLANEQRATRGQASPDDDERILLALASLPERQRAAVAMRYLDEMSVSEVASTLQVSYKSAESLLSRGRVSLSVAYKEAGRGA